MQIKINLEDYGFQSMKFNTEQLILIYKKVVEELEYGFGIPKDSFCLKHVDYALEYDFFTLEFKDGNQRYDKLKIWAFNENMLYIMNMQEEELKTKLFNIFKDSDNDNSNVEIIEKEGKIEELFDIKKQVKPESKEEKDDIIKKASEEDDDFDISDFIEEDIEEKIKEDSIRAKMNMDINDIVINGLKDVFRAIVNVLSKEGVPRENYTLKYIRKSEKYYYFCLAPRKADALKSEQTVWGTNFECYFKALEDKNILMDYMEKSHLIKIDYSIFAENQTKTEPTPDFKKKDNVEVENDELIKNTINLSKIMRRISDVREKISSVVKGQDAAIDRFISGLFDILTFKSKDSVIKGSFLFVGPSGTGKTLLAKTIADSIGMNKLVVNLSEYSDKEAVSRFRGFDRTFKDSRPGLVTSFIDKNPNTVIIFDEVDKADVAVKNILLQLYNDGFIVDPQLEKSVSFKDTILIFTTNAGEKLYEENEGKLSTLSNKKIVNALKNEVNAKGEPVFPASLISRFSSKGIVVFEHLEPYTLFEITKNSFKDKIKNFEDNNIAKIEFDDDLITALIYRIGGKADGRNLIGLVSKYIEDETIEGLSQLDEEKISKIKKIKFSIDKTNNQEYFSEKTANALVFMDYAKYKDLDLNIDGIEFYHASTLDKAKELLRKYIDFIIIDVMTNVYGSSIYNDIEDIESDGRELITYCNGFHSEIPIYVINEGRKNNEFQTLFKIGVKGLINLGDIFKSDTALARARASMTKNCYSLSRANKVLQYRTRQKCYDDVIEIEMYNLKFVIDYNVEDDDFVMDFDRPTITFNDVIGQDDAKETLKDFIKYLNNPVTYLENGVRAPRGILFYGPPGTGKTLLAKALAGESTVSFIQKNASDFVNKSPEELEKLFARARKYAPAIIFLDEVDAIAKERMGFSSNESVLNKLLSEMDGFKLDLKRPVIVIAATNFPIEKSERNSVALDPAFVRRFDRKIKIGLPNKDERIQFINYYLGKHSINTISKECINNISNRTIYYSPADLEQLIEHAIRNAKGSILTDELLSNTVDENKHGKENKSSEDDMKRTAIHESGHALVCYLCGITPAYLTIISRSGYGGYMAYGDDLNQQTYTKQELLDRIAISLAGRAAEIIEYGDKLGLTTGPQSDLFNATSIAKSIISDYGMNDSLISFDAIGKIDDSILMNDINKLLNQEFDRAKKLIINNKTKFNNLVESLLERNSLTENEIIEILKD